MCSTSVREMVMAVATATWELEDPSLVLNDMSKSYVGS